MEAISRVLEHVNIGHNSYLKEQVTEAYDRQMDLIALLHICKKNLILTQSPSNNNKSLIEFINDTLNK